VRPKLVLFGAPGAGKGTQAAKLKARYGAAHLSTGDVLREAIRRDTPLGREAALLMDKGFLVPDEVVLGLVAERLSACADGFILDGFPRTMAQAEAFSHMLLELGLELDAVISLEIDSHELLQRLSGRRVCPACNLVYHVDFMPKDAVCEKDGTCLVQRDDDKEDALLVRLEAFERQTMPLKTYYAGKHLLLSVNAKQSPERVFADIESGLESRQG
jgi:adenylate kinase